TYCPPLAIMHLRHRLTQLPHQHLQTIAQLAINPQRRGRLKAAVDHAVLAAWVLAGAVVFPLRVVHEALERGVVLVRDEVARPFPTFDVSRRVAPRGARQLALASEE